MRIPMAALVLAVISAAGSSFGDESALEAGDWLDAGRRASQIDPVVHRGQLDDCLLRGGTLVGRASKGFKCLCWDKTRSSAGKLCPAGGIYENYLLKDVDRRTLVKAVIDRIEEDKLARSVQILRAEKTGSGWEITLGVVYRTTEIMKMGDDRKVKRSAYLCAATSGKDKRGAPVMSFKSCEPAGFQSPHMATADLFLQPESPLDLSGLEIPVEEDE